MMEEAEGRENGKVEMAPPRYATREVALGHGTQVVRFKDVYVEGLGTFKIKSLDDLAYSRITAMPMKSNGQLDRIEAQLADARLIIACVVDPETNGPFFVDADLPQIRRWDAAITLRLASAIRDHIGVPEEQAAKN